MKRLIIKSIVAAVALASFGLASAQDIKEHTIKFGVNGPRTTPPAPACASSPNSWPPSRAAR
jgi:hypothetical protein